MRLEILLIATVAGVRGQLVSLISNLTLPPDVASQVILLDKDDYVGYAAQFGMNLTFYEAVTSDGWVLGLWRLRSMDIFDSELSAPVIVSHGFGSSSFDYMTNMRNESTAFVLADNGYDVWLTNYRANQFSNAIRSNGTTRAPKPEEYYRATWQYSGDFDLPAIFDKVLEETQQSKFYLIGHSMGTTIPFAFLSQNHSYDEKLSHFAAVVPVLKFGPDTSAPLKLALEGVPPLIETLQVTEGIPVVNIPIEVAFEQLFGRQIVASDGSADKRSESFLQTAVCGILPPVCVLAFGLLFNRELYTSLYTDDHFNQTRGAILLNKTPGGITLMNAYNYGHEWEKQPWEKIDFRKMPMTDLTNEGEYNSTDPPKYNFGALKVQYSLFYVKNDIFTGVETAKEVIAELNATDYRFIDGDNLTHVDAVVGFDTRCYTINPIMQKFQDLENKRGADRETYRERVSTFVESLGFENGCPDPSV